MINWIWAVAALASVLAAFLSGNLQEVSAGVFASVQDAMQLVISLSGMFCFWGGMLRIAEQSGLTKKIAKRLSPLLRILFRDAEKNEELKNAVSMNITANILGLGNAATPLGLKAMRRFERNEKHPDTATDDMIVFVVLNTAALRVLPTTVALLRYEYGSASPMEILPAAVLTSACALLVGLAAAKTLGGRRDE